MLDDKEKQKPELQSHTPHKTTAAAMCWGRGMKERGQKEKEKQVGVILSSPRITTSTECWARILEQTSNAEMVRPAQPGSRLVFLVFSGLTLAFALAFATLTFSFVASFFF